MMITDYNRVTAANLEDSCSQLRLGHASKQWEVTAAMQQAGVLMDARWDPANPGTWLAVPSDIVRDGPLGPVVSADRSHAFRGAPAFGFAGQLVAPHDSEAATGGQALARATHRQSVPLVDRTAVVASAT